MIHDSKPADDLSVPALERNADGLTITDVTFLKMSPEMRGVVLRALKYAHQAHRVYITQSHDHIVENGCADCAEAAAAANVEASRLETVMEQLEGSTVARMGTTFDLAVPEWFDRLTVANVTDEDVQRLMAPYITSCAGMIVLAWFIEARPEFKAHFERAAADLRRRDAALEHQVEMREMAVSASEQEIVNSALQAQQAEQASSAGFNISSGDILAPSTHSRH